MPARLPPLSTTTFSSRSGPAANSAPSCSTRPWGAYPTPVTWVPPEALITRSIVISDRVRVPVLSEAMTEAEPSVSTDDSFLTIALCLAIRCTPSASTTDRIAGSPSGTAATASDTPSSRTRVKSAAVRISEISRMVATTTTAMMTTAMPSMRPMRPTSFSSGVGSSAVASSISATLPISVSIPVAVITARPLP